MNRSLFVTLISLFRRLIPWERWHVYLLWCDVIQLDVHSYTRGHIDKLSKLTSASYVSAIQFEAVN